MNIFSYFEEIHTALITNDIARHIMVNLSFLDYNTKTSES